MSTTETAIFAAGCFWGVEQAFSRHKGVLEAESGYSGGHTLNPDYRSVCSGTTGHAEVVRVQFDPSVVSYRELVDFFFDLHDPTTLNRQGPDVGEQYRSAIFYTTDEQRAIAEQAKEELQNSGEFKKPIVTEITKAGEFYRAEEYHQKYLDKHGVASCHIPRRSKV